MFLLLSLFWPFVALAAFSSAQHVPVSETNKGSITVTEVLGKRAGWPADRVMMAFFVLFGTFLLSSLFDEDYVQYI